MAAGRVLRALGADPRRARLAHGRAAPCGRRAARPHRSRRPRPVPADLARFLDRRRDRGGDRAAARALGGRPARRGIRPPDRRVAGRSVPASPHDRARRDRRSRTAPAQPRAGRRHGARAHRGGPARQRGGAARVALELRRELGLGEARGTLRLAARRMGRGLDARGWVALAPSPRRARSRRVSRQGSRSCCSALPPCS